jgi:hypothetical protein
VPDEYDSTAAFRGAGFRRADLTGATFRDCDFSGVRIIGSLIADLRVDGYVGESGGSVVVNDVDVTAFVEAELDRRHPEREPVREARTAEEIRDTWTLLEELWADTLAHAERLPESARQQRVDDEWSFVETLRHLVFAVDVWVGRMILGDDPAFHPLGLPPTYYAPDVVRALGLDLDGRPSYADALAALAERRVQVRAVVDVVTDDELDEVRTGVRVPASGEESHSVRAVLRVMLDEFCAHRWYAERDLRRLEEAT